MVSSDVAGGGAAAIGDCSIGSIVWVRRRNGSWWPGKILGPDELSASHVMSPRSGTPVKLLGREDASVDWYNLEKSKRVKAFRCGEFDDCIERAEATQGMPPKKREKYARREDAILHALALERQILAKKYGKAGPPVNRRHSKSLNGARGQLMVPSQKIGKGLGLSRMDKGKNQGPSSRRVKDDYEFYDDDYNPGITPRMRDLGDFGPKYSPTVSNGSQKTLLFDSAKAHPNDSPKPEDASDGIENSSEKRKRPHEGSGDDSLAKRRERRLPLHHVLENSSKSPSPHLEADGTVNLNLISEDEQPRSQRCNSLQHGDLEEDNMGSTEDTETDSSETDSQDSDSDDLASLSEGAAFIELQPKYPRRPEERDEQSISSEEVDELVLENEVSHPGFTDPASTMGISRWQHKGKRNVRSLVKKPEGSEKSFSWVSMEEINASETGMNGRDDPHSLVKSLGPQIARFGSRTTQWDWSSQYLDPSYPGRRQYVGRSMFVDVEVKVQSSMGYKKEHVPMISLRSKLTDQAIIGHPLQVEALGSNSTDSLLVEIDDWYPDMQENDAALTPTWRTARRTASARVPRPSFTSAGDESYRNPHFYDNKRGMLSNSSVKPSRKPQKKISLSGNQKTRTLSSIASQPRKSVDPRRNVPKPEPSMPTTVACIPVKLVFSRLQEELFGRHP